MLNVMCLGIFRDDGMAMVINVEESWVVRRLAQISE